MHEGYHGDVPAGCELVLQDVLTLHGSQFRDADAIVASPPCQAYSYRAMPWKKAKALPPPSNELFDACFRIQREASEAAGHYIPMVVENVKGAQPWVGRAAWHYGSYYLWGDVPALMPFAGKRSAQKRNPDGTEHPPGSWFAIADSKNRGARSTAVKNNGNGSWFNVAHGKVIPGNQAGAPQRGDGLAQRLREEQGIKQKGSGAAWFDKALDERRKEATAATRDERDSFGWAKESPLRNNNSRSDSRKAASAAIAEIPFELSNWIARCLRP